MTRLPRRAGLGMAYSVKPNEVTRPIDIGTFGSEAVVSVPNALTQLVQQALGSKWRTVHVRLACYIWMDIQYATNNALCNSWL